MNPELWLLLLWGGLVGLDLVSVPQMMIARPLVAGTVAGVITGDPGSGMVVGVILELFALDILPVGGVRYPDYGPAAVAAAYTVAGAPGLLAVGVAVVLGLLVAYAGEWSLLALRRWNSWDVHRHAAQLDAGDATVMRRVHIRGIGRDAARAVLLTGFGLALADVVRRWSFISVRGAVLLAAVMIGVALATATVGTLRLTEGRRGITWFSVGLGLGVVWVVAR
ncbi:MAG: PTS sugar transporter subunit IIC [Gemmatimonadetes bacterium]|nr:PTS sugar transporter subunit IIC [Gemmatimonadota bacterium]